MVKSFLCITKGTSALLQCSEDNFVKTTMVVSHNFQGDPSVSCRLMLIVLRYSSRTTIKERVGRLVLYVPTPFVQVIAIVLKFKTKSKSRQI